MPIIGTFSAVKDGYAGTIRTLTLNIKVQLVDVAGLGRPAVVEHLTLMAAALAASALALGALAERLRRAGISTAIFLAGTLALSMAAQLALLLDLPVPSHLLFVAIASGGATNVLSFAILARYFPKRCNRTREGRRRHPANSPIPCASPGYPGQHITLF